MAPSTSVSIFPLSAEDEDRADRLCLSSCITEILGSSATISGLQLIPFSFGTSLVSIATGFIIAKVKRTKEVLIVSFALATLGFALLATLDESSNRAKQELYLLVAALGIGGIFQAPLVLFRLARLQPTLTRSSFAISQLHLATGCHANLGDGN